MEHPNFRRTPNGSLVLKASKEAQAIGPQQGCYRAKGPEEVGAEACAHVASEGGDVSNATLTLSRWKVQFGRYQGQTFHRLLENDVGYAVNLALQVCPTVRLSVGGKTVEEWREDVKRRDPPKP